MIANSGHRLEDEEALVSALLAQRVCGLVLHNTAHSRRLRELSAPAPTFRWSRPATCRPSRSTWR